MYGTCDTGDVSESGTPGRYTRSFDGLLAALVITVVAVVAWVVFRALTSTETEVEPEAVDYLETVGLAQDSDLEVVYPPTLPDGWKATNVSLVPVPGEAPGFGLSILTDSGTFVGLRQEDDSLEDLLETYVDPEEVVEADGVEVDSPLASTWDGYADDGGDTAYAAELGEAQLLVYGSASRADLVTLIELLTTEPLAP